MRGRHYVIIRNAEEEYEPAPPCPRCNVEPTEFHLFVFTRVQLVWHWLWTGHRHSRFTLEMKPCGHFVRTTADTYDAVKQRLASEGVTP